MELNAHIPDGPLEKKWDKHRFDLKLVNPANKRKYKVIVVGSGLAGGAAAASPHQACRSATCRGSRRPRGRGRANLLRL